MFQRAIVRKPGSTFAKGITTSPLGAPDLAEALKQHAQYCTSLKACGLELTVLPEENDFPDSTFVEDVAIVTPHGAILTRPGAASRQGEVEKIRGPLSGFNPGLHEITPPGTLDGGDICQTENHFFIGLSQRTNEDGGRQLGHFLSRAGYSHSFFDIRGLGWLLHLKSGISYVGDSTMVVHEDLAGHPQLQEFRLVPVAAQEAYAANCLRINEHLLMPSGFPLLESALSRLNHPLIRLNMSEFQKMDGGLSCLSLRF